MRIASRAHRNGRGDIDVERVAPVVERDVFGVAVGGDAGIVDQHVEAAVGLLHRGEQGRDGVFAREIGRDRQCLAAARLDAGRDVVEQLGLRRATSTIFAPSAAKVSAMPRPMPSLAPVTIAILPCNCATMSSPEIFGADFTSLNERHPAKWLTLY